MKSIAIALAAAGVFAAGIAQAQDGAAVAQKAGCMSCHAVDTKKMGPAWKDVAAKLKGDKEAQAKLIKHLTTGPDGHPVIKAKSPEDTKNLVDWILSL